MTVLALLFSPGIPPSLPFSERRLHQLARESKPRTAGGEHLKLVAVSTQGTGGKVRLHTDLVRGASGV
jgi:hypothetical protein